MISHNRVNMAQLLVLELCLGALGAPDRAGELQVDAAITRGSAAQVAVSRECFFGKRGAAPPCLWRSYGSS